jgi:hypothetical protein
MFKADLFGIGEILDVDIWFVDCHHFHARLKQERKRRG